jgi:peroxiredoxin
MTSPAHDLELDRILNSLRVAVRRDSHRRRVRRQRTLVVSIAVFALSGIAVAATENWWTNADPPPNQKAVDIGLGPTKYPDGRIEDTADLARSRTVARAAGAVLVAAPREDGGYCLLPQLPSTDGKLTSAGIGAPRCFPPRKDGTAVSAFGTLLGPDGDRRWLVFGRITDPGGASLDLSEAAGETLRVPLANAGFFMAELPRTAWERLDDRADDVAVLGSDGQVLRRTCVQFEEAPYSQAWAIGGSNVNRMEGAGDCGRQGQQASAPPVKTSPAPAPPLSGIDLATGELVSLPQFAGKPVVIAFATDVCVGDRNCVGSNSSPLAFASLLAEAHPELAVVGVARRSTLSADAVKTLFGDPVIPLIHDPNRRIADAYGVEEMPTWIFLDAQQRIEARIVGHPTESETMAGVRMAGG